MEATKLLTNTEGCLDLTISLGMVLRFAEDYRKVVMNSKHELILTRSCNYEFSLEGIVRVPSVSQITEECIDC